MKTKEELVVNSVKEFLNERIFCQLNEKINRSNNEIIYKPIYVRKTNLIEKIDEQISVMLEMYEKIKEPKDNLKSLVKEMFEALEQGQTIKNNLVYHYALKHYFENDKK